MKTGRFCLAVVLVAAFGLVFCACNRNAVSTRSAQSEPKSAQSKEGWSKALSDARQELQKNKDQESADFVTGVLDSLERPDGMSPAALQNDLSRIKSRVRALVRAGSLSSAAIMNWAHFVVTSPHDTLLAPAQPNQKTGGHPGAGGLVLYLPFDTPDEGGVIRDASGAGNDGRVYGAKWVSEGKTGGAYQFCITNLDDRIVIPNSDLLNPDHTTVSAWIKTARATGFSGRIVDKYCVKGYSLAVCGYVPDNREVGGKLLFQAISPTKSVNILSDNTLGDNRWHQVAVTFDGTTARSYVDGKEQSHSAKTAGQLGKNDWDLCIGNSVVDYGGGDFFAYDGLIDEVRIYNRALSGDEIKTLASVTKAGVEITRPPADNGGKADAGGRLKQVKALFDQGLINQEDYDKKVKEIMDSL